MADVSIGILGLGRVGASIMLALKRYNEKKDTQHKFEVVCADFRPGIREDALKNKIVATIERDLFAAARGRDIVVLALPYADTQAAYKEIGSELRAGAVVLDTSPLKLPPLEWAKKYLGQDVHMVGITPILNPRYLFDGLDDTLHAQADLFDKGNMLLMPSPSCVKEAVELAADFSSIIGSTAHFFDPAEHDSLVALADGLPALLGFVSFYFMSKSAGWDDAQRLTNPSFGRLTHHLYDTHPDDLRDTWLHNRENMLRQLNSLIGSLQDFRTILAHNDRGALEAALSEAGETYSAWINRRSRGVWDDDTSGEMAPSIGSSVMTGLFGGYLTKRLQGGKNGGKD
jgi:prephenate dehydrogenase